jgi:hypothetical protein
MQMDWFAAAVGFWAGTAVGAVMALAVRAVVEPLERQGDLLSELPPAELGRFRNGDPTLACHLPEFREAFHPRRVDGLPGDAGPPVTRT